MTRALLALLLALGACGGEGSCGPDAGSEPSGLLGQPIGAGPLVAPVPAESEPVEDIPLDVAWETRVIVPGAPGSGQFDGADGVYAADLDGDLQPDITSGAEQGLRLEIARNPGVAGGLVYEPWPHVTLPLVPPEANLCSPEDAVFADVDEDGALDAVVACESGGGARVAILFSPPPPITPGILLDANNWDRVDLPASAGFRSMRVVVADIAGDARPEIVVGEKESPGPLAAFIAIYSTTTPRDGASWERDEVAQVGWVMNLEVRRFNDDEDLDIIYGDRDPINAGGLDSSRRGVRWLQGPAWAPHQITAADAEHKWHHTVEWNGDGLPDVVDCRSTASGANELQILVNLGGGLAFSPIEVPMPAGVGQCQHAVTWDPDMDGDLDLGVSAAQAGGKSAVFWLRRSGPPEAPAWERGEISGVLGALDVKGDNFLPLDLDGDGDPDVPWSEQHVDEADEVAPTGNGPGLGLVAFINPLIELPPVALPPQVTCQLLTSGSTTSDGASAQTAPIAPPANSVVIGAVVSANASGQNTSTFSGAGLDWSQQVGTVGYAASNARRLSVRRAAAGPSPGSGAITLDFAGVAQSSFAWIFVACADADSSNPVVQVATATTGAGTATTIHTGLGPLAGAGSRVLVWTASNLTSSIGQDPDTTEIADVNINAGGATLALATALGQVDADPTSGAAALAQVMVELRMAP